MADRVKLADYDYVVINSSAGKDSQCMLTVLVEKAKEENYPLERIVVVHADLSHEEWPGTKELAQRQAEHYGLRFEVVRRKRGSFLDMVRQRWAKLKSEGRNVPPWPDSVNRTCTSDCKRGPISTIFTRLAGEFRAIRGKKAHCRILNCMGMRAGESCKRAKLNPFERNEDQCNGRRTVDNWLPIHGWGVDEVWAKIRESGVEHHPAYDLGSPRLSCMFCILAPRESHMLAGKHNRPLLDEYIQIEQETGFAFRKGLPLLEVRDALDRGEEPGEIRTWEA